MAAKVLIARYGEPEVVIVRAEKQSNGTILVKVRTPDGRLERRVLSEEEYRGRAKLRGR